MQRYVLALLAAVILGVSSALALPVEWSGFELGTKDDFQSQSGSAVAVCSTGLPYNPENITFRTGRCAGRVYPNASGTGAFRFGRVSSIGGMTSTIGTNDAYYRFNFLVHTAPIGDSEEFAVVRDNQVSPAYKLSVHLKSNRTIALRDSTGSVISQGSTVLAVDTWYQIRIKACTGSSCTSTVQIGTTPEVSGSGNYGTSPNGSLSLGKLTNSFSNPVVYWYDDVMIDDAEYPGNVRVKMLLPNGNGDLNQWTTGTPPSDWSSATAFSTGSAASVPSADYLRNPGSVVDETVVFNYQSATAQGINGLIYGLKAVALGNKNTPGGSILPKVRISSGGLYTEIGGSNPTSDTFVKALLSLTSPFTADPYAPSEVDDIQAGISEGTTGRVQVYSLPIMVAYDETQPYNTPTPAPTYIPPTPPVPPYVKVHPGSTGYADGQKAGSGRHLTTPTSTVYRITSLSGNTRGAGTLRQCLEASGPRTCVFEIAGYIDCALVSGDTYADLDIVNPYLTIAGQTAPNPGIHIRNCKLNIKTHDVLIQHISVRSGDAEPGSRFTERDAFSLDPTTSAVYNITLDHVTMANATDENFSTAQGSFQMDNISVTNSIIGPALRNSTRYKYYRACSQAECDANPAYCTAIKMFNGQQCTDYKINHAMAGLLYPVSRINFHNNLIAGNIDRHFRTYGSTSIEFLNNVVYGWGGNTCANLWNCSESAGAAGCKIYMAGNYYKKASYSPHCPILHSSTSLPTASQAFLDHNICATRSSDTGSDWLCSQWNTSMRVFAPPFAESGNLVIKGPQTAYDDIVNSTNILNGGVGARPWSRFIGDTNLINETKNNTGTLKDCITNCEGTEVPVFGSVGASTGWPSIGTNTRTLTQLDAGGWNKDTIENNGRTALENYIFSFNDTGNPTYVANPTPTPTPIPTATPTGPTPTPTYIPPSVVPCKDDWKSQWSQWSQYQIDYLISQNDWEVYDPGDDEPSGNQMQASYYDALMHNLTMPFQVGNTGTIGPRLNILHRSYRDGYVDFYNAGVAGFILFTNGLRRDFELNGDNESKQAVFDLSRNAAFANGAAANTANPNGNDPNFPTTDGSMRENAYRIVAELDARALGFTPRASLDSYLDQAIDHLTKTTNPQQTTYTKVFYVAVTCKALIQAYEEYPAYPGRANIQPAISAALDWIWQYAWVPYNESDEKSQAFLYAYPDGQESLTGGQPDLNGLVVPVFGWMYKQDFNPKWRLRGDTVFCGTITQTDEYGFNIRGPFFGNTNSAATNPGGKKQFNQTYFWSYKYLGWAETAPGATPTPTPSPSPTSTATPVATPTRTPTPAATLPPQPTLPAGYTPGPKKRFTPNFPLDPCDARCCIRGTCPTECGENYCAQFWRLN